MSSIRDKGLFKTSLVYFGLTGFSLLFMGIYYAVDHGLRDMRMTLLFLPCLILAILFLALSFLLAETESVWTMIFHMGFAAMYLYFVLSSIIQMANSHNDHVAFFLVGGILLMVVGAVGFSLQKVIGKEK